MILKGHRKEILRRLLKKVVRSWLFKDPPAGAGGCGYIFPREREKGAFSTEGFSPRVKMRLKMRPFFRSQGKNVATYAPPKGGSEGAARGYNASLSRASKYRSGARRDARDNPNENFSTKVRYFSALFFYTSILLLKNCCRPRGTRWAMLALTVAPLSGSSACHIECCARTYTQFYRLIF